MSPGAEMPKPDGQPADLSKPVKVFIMLGQSNMVGVGAISRGSAHPLEIAVKKKGLYPFLLDDSGKWSERKDVRHIMIVQGGPKKEMPHNEWLRVGAGSGKMVAFIGVEHGIGHLLGNAYADPSLLLKCCNGNRSLGYDFVVTEKKDKKNKRSKETEDTTYTYAGYGEGPMRWVKGTTPEPVNLVRFTQSRPLRLGQRSRDESFQPGRSSRFPIPHRCGVMTG